MNSGIVFDIMRFSTHDGPGIRTTVFLKGCPLHCRWCHNPESQNPRRELMLRPSLCIACLACVDACPEGAIRIENQGTTTDPARCRLCGACVAVCYAGARETVGQEMTVQAVLAEIAKDAVFYEESHGGVTFSGGEALVQNGFLEELLLGCRERGYHTALDTSGYADWAVIERVCGLVDLFLYDLKFVDDRAHRRFTGVSNSLILANLRHLAELGHKIILRIPLIPGVNVDDESIRQMAELAAALPGLQRVDLLPYHTVGVEKYRRLNRGYDLHEFVPLAETCIEEIVNQFKLFSLNVQVGG